MKYKVLAAVTATAVAAGGCGIAIHHELPVSAAYGGKEATATPCYENAQDAASPQHVLATGMRGTLMLKRSWNCPGLYWAEFAADINNPTVVTLRLAVGNVVQQVRSDNPDGHVRTLTIAAYEGDETKACVLASVSLQRCVEAKAA